MRLYVGNFPYNTTEKELRELFTEHGDVKSCDVLQDRETGRSRGFGFIEMDDAEAQSAIDALNGRDLGGRSLRVSKAKPRKQGNRRGRGGGRGGSGRQQRWNDDY